MFLLTTGDMPKKDVTSGLKSALVIRSISQSYFDRDIIVPSRLSILTLKLEYLQKKSFLYDPPRFRTRTLVG